MSGAGAAVRRALTDPSAPGDRASDGGRASRGGLADRARRRGAHQARRARGTLVLVVALVVAAPVAASLLPDGSDAALPVSRQAASPGPEPLPALPVDDPGLVQPRVTGPLLLVQDLDGVFPGARVLQELYAGPLVTLPGDEATAPDGSSLRGWCGDVPVTGGGPPLTAWAGSWTDALPDRAGPDVGASPRDGLAPGPGTVLEVVSRFPDAGSAETAAATTTTSPTACRGRRAGEVWQVQGQPSAALAVAVAPWRDEATWAVRTTAVRGSLEVSLLCVVSAPDPAAAAGMVRPVAEAAVARAVALPDGA